MGRTSILAKLVITHKRQNNLVVCEYQISLILHLSSSNFRKGSRHRRGAENLPQGHSNIKRICQFGISTIKIACVHYCVLTEKRVQLMVLNIAKTFMIYIQKIYLSVVQNLCCFVVRYIVFIIDGNSKIGVHVRTNLCYIICLRNLIRSRAATNPKKTFLLMYTQQVLSYLLI